MLLPKTVYETVHCHDGELITAVQNELECGVYVIFTNKHRKYDVENSSISGKA